MADLVPDAASVMVVGARDRQEDALIADFSQADRLGLAVLSDGMGGHEDGDLASRVIAGEMFGELFMSGAKPDALMREAPELLRSALEAANRRLRSHVTKGVISASSGGTLVSVAIAAGRLHWISVGDSPLYLFRDRQLIRLNEIHSMAPQIDLMVREGQISAEEGRDHPQRNWLTSAVTGGALGAVDCPATGLDLQDGDIVILASDGLNTLTDRVIRSLTRRTAHRGSQRVARALIDAVEGMGIPDQDNASLIVVTMHRPGALAPGVVAAKARDLSVAVDEWLELTAMGVRNLFRPRVRQ